MENILQNYLSNYEFEKELVLWLHNLFPSFDVNLNID